MQRIRTDQIFVVEMLFTIIVNNISTLKILRYTQGEDLFFLEFDSFTFPFFGKTTLFQFWAKQPFFSFWVKQPFFKYFWIEKNPLIQSVTQKQDR